MTDIEYFLFGAVFGLSMKVLVAILDAISARFKKEGKDVS